MENLEKTLKDLGFSDKKSAIYLALLELGEASIIEIARKSDIKRTTVYNILPKLTADGLDKKGVKSKKTIFYVDDPRKIKTELEEKLHKANTLLPELLAIQNILPNKPKITFYEGLGGMKDLYRDTLNSLSPGDTLLSFTGLTDFKHLMPQDFADWYIAERAHKKIRIKVIASDSETARAWKSAAQAELREIKIITDQKIKFDADTEIYGHKIALISYKENFMGVIIESVEISQMQRMSFELMWNLLKD